MKQFLLAALVFGISGYATAEDRTTAVPMAKPLAAGEIVPVHHRHHLPACEPGFKWVEETCYKDVERYVCKMIPEVVKTKKWVYSCKDDPFCIKECSLFGKGHCGVHGCKDKDCGHDGCSSGSCGHCSGPYCRIQLVKKEVVCEELTTKCIVEKIVEQIPYTVCRKVPCDASVPPGAVTPLPTVSPEAVGAPARKLP